MFRNNRSLYGFEEAHEACTACFVQLVDTGIGQDLGEDMADLVLQDEVDRISIQLRVPGEDLLGPGSVFLQGFGVEVFSTFCVGK